MKTRDNGGRLLPRMVMVVAAALAASLVLPLHAQENSAPPPTTVPAGAPAPAPAAVPPAESAPAQTDPCADLRVEVKKLQSTLRNGSQKKRRTGTARHPKRHAKAKKKLSGARAGIAGDNKSSTGKSAPKTSVCAGAMSMKEVRDILGTTRNLSGRNLNCLDFTGFDLKKVNFSGALMIQTNCTRADLEDSNLERANLTDANLTRANLHLSRLVATTLTNARLDGALWTDRRPCAPGSIGVCRDTFQQ